jgi:hypothetical protein
VVLVRNMTILSVFQWPNGGKFNEKYFRDGVHLTPEDSQIYADVQTLPGFFSGIITLLFRDYYCTWILFRDYYVAFQGLLLYLESFQGLLLYL